MYPYWFMMLFQLHWDDLGLGSLNETTIDVHTKNIYTAYHVKVYRMFN